MHLKVAAQYLFEGSFSSMLTLYTSRLGLFASGYFYFVPP